MLAPARLRGRDRYERRMTGWIDDRPPDAFAYTIVLSDDDASVEIGVVALPSPEYRILEVHGRALAGAVDATALAGVSTLAGVPLLAGLTRRAWQATGRGLGADLVVQAVIEAARLARQVTRQPREDAERAAGDARACWELDTRSWIDLPDSCFTYSAAGRALLDTRAVAVAMTPDLYSPRPAQTRVFERRKTARLERRDDRLTLFSSMHDNVHGFDLTCEIDLATARIIRAEHQTPRLPYAGLCGEPQRKLVALLGETADAGLARRVQSHLGGPTGCAQLFDLTVDVLRLLA